MALYMLFGVSIAVLFSFLANMAFTEAFTPDDATNQRHARQWRETFDRERPIEVFKNRNSKGSQEKLIDLTDKVIQYIREVDRKATETADKLCDNDITQLVSLLTGLYNKVSTMEKDHKKQVADLTQRISTSEEEYKRNMTLMGEKHERQITDLDAKYLLFFEKVAQKEIKTKSELSNLAEKVGYAVAFSATNQNQRLTTKAGQTIVYPDVIMQIGQGYNPRTGVFTALRRGLYVFHLAGTDWNDCNLALFVKVNNKDVIRLYARDTDHHDQSSVSTVTELQTGDRVYIVPYYKGCNLNPTRYNVFSGYLLKPL